MVLFPGTQSINELPLCILGAATGAKLYDDPREKAALLHVSHYGYRPHCWAGVQECVLRSSALIREKRGQWSGVRSSSNCLSEQDLFVLKESQPVVLHYVVTYKGGLWPGIIQNPPSLE